MTQEELEALLAQCANPDTAPVALSTLKDKVSVLISDCANAKSKSDEDAKKIAELRDVNMRMFLRTTSEVKDQEEHEETVDELNARLREALLGGKENENGND